MKRLIELFVLASLLLLTSALLAKPLITFIAKKQLEKVFRDSQVSIGRCSFMPLKQLSFFDVEVKKQKIYDFKIKEAEISYTPLSILKRNILKFGLKGASVDIDLGEKDFSALKSYIRLSSKSFVTLQVTELSHLNINLKSKDLNVSAQISAGLNLRTQAVDYLNSKIDFIQVQGFRLENASLELDANSKPGSLSIAAMNYDKVKIENLSAKPRLENKALFLEALGADIFGGRVGGDLTARLDKNIGCQINLNFNNLNIEKFIEDFNLNEKFQMTGSLGGKVSLQGSALNISLVSGDFSTAKPGGMLTITDKRFLENLARTSGQSLNILVESFKYYHYNVGIMKLGLDKDNLILDVRLEGEAGKRNLNIIVHDFNRASQKFRPL